jgi:hypothetical protein
MLVTVLEDVVRAAGVVVGETRKSATNARARRSARASGTARRRGKGLVGAAMVD